jgi:hypothetical protein
VFKQEQPELWSKEKVTMGGVQFPGSEKDHSGWGEVEGGEIFWSLILIKSEFFPPKRYLHAFPLPELSGKKKFF